MQTRKNGTRTCLLSDYGGPTETMALMPGSPASNAGANFDDGNGDPITADQRGVPRAPSPDIGAFQDYPIKFSTTSGDDEFELVESGSNVLQYVNGVMVNSYDLAGLDEVTIAGAVGGNDTLELNVPDASLKLTTDSSSSTANLSLTLDAGTLDFPNDISLAQVTANGDLSFDAIANLASANISGNATFSSNANVGAFTLTSGTARFVDGATLNSLTLDNGTP